MDASSITRELHERLIAHCEGLPAAPTAVAHPCDVPSLEGAMAAAKANLIIPLLVGPEARIRRVAAEAGIDLAGVRIVDTPHSHASAAKAVAMVRSGEVDGADEGQPAHRRADGSGGATDSGIRTERRISHVFVMDVPTYPKPLLITDAAINIPPTLDDKARHRAATRSIWRTRSASRCRRSPSCRRWRR